MNIKTKFFKLLGVESAIIIFRLIRALRTITISVLFILIYIKLSNGGKGQIELPGVVFSFTLGTVIAVLRDFINHSTSISRLNVFLKWGFQWIVIITGTVLIWYLLLFLFQDLNVKQDKILYTKDFLTDPRFLLVIERVIILSFIIITYVELENRLGVQFLFDILFQTKEKAVVEDRIFLFMDLNDSTSINERMGNRQYYDFINTCYYLMSDAVLQSGAEIVKYVGDEVILTWKTNKAGQYFNAIVFFELFVQKLKKQEDSFIKRFNEIPSFKAGMHIGEVVKAEVGYLKKQKDYYGDVMNITARILGKCERYDTDFLISEEALTFLISEIDINNFYSKIEGVKLKGKLEIINLYKKKNTYSSNKASKYSTALLR